MVDLRGNINSRMQKLNDNDWNGAIFAAAGLERINLEHEHTIGLTWMIPAPAQGAIMIAALEKDEYVREACAKLNHEPTEICTTIERDFLRILEGGCTAPIGALAYINNNEQVILKGVLLTVDGSKKLEAEFNAPLGSHTNLSRDCADSILSRGGRHLMNELVESQRSPNLFSTKKLTTDQKGLFKEGLFVDSEDFIKINPTRIAPAIIKAEYDNVVLSSKNAVESLLTHTTADQLKFKNIYCVGRKTKRMIENTIGPVKHAARSAKKLAEHLVEYIDGTEVTYFCSNMRMDDLPSILSENGIVVNEIETYKTKYDAVEVGSSVEGVLFYSPSTIKSYLTKNTSDKIAYCIGETTATEARKHFKTVYVAKMPDAESVIALVNEQIKI